MARISRKYDKIDSVISKLKAYSTLFQVYKHNIDQKQKNIEYLPNIYYQNLIKLNKISVLFNLIPNICMI